MNYIIKKNGFQYNTFLIYLKFLNSNDSLTNTEKIQEI